MNFEFIIDLYKVFSLRLFIFDRYIYLDWNTYILT